MEHVLRIAISVGLSLINNLSIRGGAHRDDLRPVVRPRSFRSPRSLGSPIIAALAIIMLLGVLPAILPQSSAHAASGYLADEVMSGKTRCLSPVFPVFPGLPRVIDGNLDGIATVDIGAYEYLPGDVNYDGRVNILDLIAIRASLGQDPGSSPAARRADANADGRVNIEDLIFVRGRLGK